MKVKMLPAFMILGVFAIIILCFTPVVLGDNALETGIPLQGEMVEAEETQETLPEGPELDEEGKPVPRASEQGAMPRIDPGLLDQAGAMAADEMIRVIVFLDYQPQTTISREVQQKYAGEMENIRQSTRSIKQKYASTRQVELGADNGNYRKDMMDMSGEDKDALKALNEQNEALSLVISREISARLNAEINAHQGSVKEGIEALGGTVEYSAVVGNTIVAQVPAGRVQDLAAMDKVIRVTQDRLMEQHLNNADNATKVSSAGGLWANGQDGGIYDPAVLDSGTDLNHPGLAASASRENHWSWYLVAGAGHPDWNDYAGIDDRNGHGTHVMGIVGSYGTGAYPNHKGMSFGVDKAVHLKAGFHKTNGRASMYWSDAMWLVDRALNREEELYPTYGVNEFNDDVDGFNLSYGGDLASDESDFTRFWDSVVSTYPSTVVTISAGNSGPSNSLFTDPGSNYNAITVASVDDRNTASRDDDVIASYSSRGPTANGRRKPDISAPGSGISSANTFWETQSDYINKSGTSMAAPMILGLSMDLMDAGVLNEKEIKALLLNTAQKNEPGINFESDADGWSTAHGWGYVNAWAAYYHRNDVDLYTVTERNTAGDYILLSGRMRDEGSGAEGRDRATMAWNRRAVYKAHAYPTTYHALSDLNLRLYREADNVLIDSDLDGDDNVHQVRVNSGTGMTDVVIKAYAWSTNFAHGGTTEQFALATEENFTQVDLPADFTGLGYGNPGEMEPNEVRQFKFAIRNNSTIASHSNQMDLLVPAGWARLSGADPFAAGSLDSGETSSIVTWTLRAQPTVQDNVSVPFNHTHNSYAEQYGPKRWHTLVNVRWDKTPPSPNPLTWSTLPHETGTTTMSMTATTATDLHGPVAYHFWRYNTPSSNSTDLGWHASRTYNDSGLSPNTQYRYYVQARDNASTPNIGGWSAYSDDYTDIQKSTGIAFGTITASSIQVRSNNTPSNLALGSSGLYFHNITKNTNSGWRQNNNYWTSPFLTPNTAYAFRATSRNGDGAGTGWSPTGQRYTRANPPLRAGFTNVTPTSIRANWKANGNPADTEYYCRNITTGESSGWTTATSWNNTGLDCETLYTYRVIAKNEEGYLTDWVDLGSQATATCPDICECDLNSDHKCDMQDWVIFGEDWGRTDCNNTGVNCECDLNKDGKCDMQDWVMFGDDWGRTDCP